MTRKGVTPNVFTYNSFIQGFCHSGQWEEVTSLLNGIMNEGVHPNLVTFNSLINALCKEKRIEEAITMLNLMCQGSNALCKEKTEEAITMLELLSQRGVKLYGVTYNIMIRLYCGQGEMTKAKDVFDSMGTRGL
ncbi:pentatricopeptide repeat-containing protein [Gossypium australe]|uniref:Pentatricopeptide repeat-containing protein n=1 Tax=Gossypium australe TaxID=47621 RepID=A0A5B6WGZ4_9ROSI|nr:pentatricopeptide repeat-containing protein [Gossypium australe]